MKKIASTILATSLILSTVSVAYASEMQVNGDTLVSVNTLSSGNCGEYAFWSYDPDTTTLTISGTGAMEDYPNYAPPWVSYRSEITTIVIEEGITTLGWSAFYGCEAMTKIDIPNTVTSLEYGALGYCTSLSSIYLPDSITEIGLASFVGCSALTEITVPPATTILKDGAFMECPNLQIVNLPVTLTYIGSSAFKYSNSIKQVNYQGTSWNRSQIKVNSNYNSSLTGANWSYGTYQVQEPEVEATFPDWSKLFVEFATPTIMPTMTVANYGEEVSRAEVAEFMYNMFGNGEVISGSHPFSDVNETQNAINWCYEKGFMLGVNETYFGSDSAITREQIAIILENIAKKLEKQDVDGAEEDLDLFLDRDLVSQWAYSSMVWAVSNGLMNGDTNNNLSPNGNVSFIEMAVILYNFDRL